MIWLIPLTALLIGLIVFIIIVKRNTIVINKADPENIQLVLDLKQKKIKKG